MGLKINVKQLERREDHEEFDSNFITLSLLFGIQLSYGKEAEKQVGKNDSSVEVRYRKYEKFNLNDLVIDGKLMVPGDLSVEDLGEVDLRRKLFEKPHFKNERLRDLKNI